MVRQTDSGGQLFDRRRAELLFCTRLGRTRPCAFQAKASRRPAAPSTTDCQRAFRRLEAKVARRSHPCIVLSSSQASSIPRGSARKLVSSRQHPDTPIAQPWGRLPSYTVVPPALIPKIMEEISSSHLHFFLTGILLYVSLLVVAGFVHLPGPE
jgi:hypothetical protein